MNDLGIVGDEIEGLFDVVLGFSGAGFELAPSRCWVLLTLPQD
jgi:hypothetical protein